MARLANFGLKDRTTDTARIEDIVNKEVQIQSADVQQGQYGDYVVMQVILPSGEIIPVASGGMFVVDAVKDALSHSAFPCAVRFLKRGRCWIFD